MGIGKSSEYEHCGSLDSWVGDSGCGLSNISKDDLSHLSLINFMLDQGRRFKLPDLNRDFISTVGHRVLMYFDLYDPYYQFCNDIGDVVMTNDWCNYTYDIKNVDGGVDEACPEELESFTLVQGRDQVIFNSLINNPGIENLPNKIHENLMEWLGPELFCEEDVFADLDKEASDWIRFVSGDNWDKAWNYVKFATWATYVWYFGPLGRDARKWNPIHEACHESGECILHQGFTIEPEFYTKVQRPPNSCVVCGLDSWCVELVHVQGVTRRICEYHLNGDQPPYGFANCGQKICKYVVCNHHPDHGKHNALLGVMRGSGQLNKARGNTHPQIGAEHKMAIGAN